MQTFPLIFLGAGASVEFGIPDMRQMTRKFVSQNERYREKIVWIVRRLRRVGYIPNIENILSFVRGEANPKRTLLDSSPFVANFVCGRRFRRLGYNPAARELIADIQVFIAEECLITHEYRVDPIVNHYSGFFKHLAQCYRTDRQGQDGLAEVHMFTTNYDNVIERYAERKGIGKFDGYELTADGTCRFAPHLYETTGPLRLYKLHGSTTLGLVRHRTTEEEAVIQSNLGLRIGDKYRDDWIIVDRIMIHGYEKDPSEEPYFDLLYLLKKKLSIVDDVIVIGYSFSDKAILKIFRGALTQRTHKLRLIILDRNASKVKNYLFGDASNVLAINGSSSEYYRIGGA